jgi:hypothetical protein
MHPTLRSLRFAAVVLLAAAPLAGQAPPAETTAAAPAPAAFDVARSDAKAVAVADRVVAALGGPAAWEATRFVRFDFAGRRRHWWDRYDGRHRIEGTTQQNEPYVVLHNVQTREGKAWLNGQPVEGDRAKEMLENAYGAWVNDTYWLLMPFKMKDPGVVLASEGEEQVNGSTYDKVRMSFEGVGLTPQDRYWVYVDRASGLIDRWAYVLQGQSPPPTIWIWKDWQSYGRIKLSPLRVNPESGRELRLDAIALPDAMPDAVFTDPAPVASP